MANKCYAMVRGSAIRITGLTSRGRVPDEVQYVTSKSVATITINEMTESASNELLKTEDDQPRLRFVRPEQMIRYTVDIDFLRVDPGVLALAAGVRAIYSADIGFGEAAFGEYPFGGIIGTAVGFDSEPHRPAAAFGMEVWSKLAGSSACVDGQQEYGYTLFPFLKGGRLSGFEFKNGLVSFNLRGAQTRKAPLWDVGPHDLEAPYQRLIEPVSRNTMFRQMITTAPPPPQSNGIQTATDVLDNGTAADPMPDPNAVLSVDGGGAVAGSPFIISGGRAI